MIKEHYIALVCLQQEEKTEIMGQLGLNAIYYALFFKTFS